MTDLPFNKEKINSDRKKLIIANLALAIFIILIGLGIFPLTEYIIKTTKENIVKEELMAKQEKKEKMIIVAKKYILDNSDRISNKMAEEIAKEVMNTNIPIVILAIMKVESSYNPTALSNKGAMGLMQIMSVHLPALKEKNILQEKRDLFDISMNINAGNYIWSNMWDKNKGDIHKTFMNYYGMQDGDYFTKFSKSYFELKYLFNQTL